MSKTWNYRIVRLPCVHPEVDLTIPLSAYEHFKYEIHEVYYDSDNNPVMRTQNAIGREHLTAFECEDETPEELISWVERILKSIKTREVLDDELIQYDKETDD